MGTTLALIILFIKPTLYTILFVGVSTVLIVLVYQYALSVLRNPRWVDKVIEPEIKFIFLVLLAFIYFAKIGDGHAVLPAFILGLLMSNTLQNILNGSSDLSDEIIPGLVSTELFNQILTSISPTDHERITGGRTGGG